MAKIEYNVRSGHKDSAGRYPARREDSDESAFLNIEKRVYEEDADNPLNYTQEQVAHYELRWDEGEVMLIKDGEEIVYSEILGES
jgi:hypothetical protein